MPLLSGVEKFQIHKLKGFELLNLKRNGDPQGVFAYFFYLKKVGIITLNLQKIVNSRSPRAAINHLKDNLEESKDMILKQLESKCIEV